MMIGEFYLDFKKKRRAEMTKPNEIQRIKMREYLEALKEQAKKCPMNRQGTRQEFGLTCSDDDLDRHHMEELLFHFICVNNNAAMKWAETHIRRGYEISEVPQDVLEAKVAVAV